MVKSIFSEEHKAAISKGKTGVARTSEAKSAIAAGQKAYRQKIKDDNAKAQELLAIANSFSRDEITFDDFLKQFNAVQTTN